MAPTYWDYNSTASTTTTGSYYSSNCINTFATTTTPSCYGNNAINALAYYTPPPRQILVPTPAHWTRQQQALFVRLVNDETKTGWLITMLIEGNILITDPNVEIREMEAFALLLKRHAGAEDQRRIDAFFAANPCKAA